MTVANRHAHAMEDHVKLMRLSNRFPAPLFAGDFLDDIPDRLRTLFGNGIERGQPMGWMPAMEIEDTKNTLVVTAELPGLNAKDVDISVDDGVLTISGEKQDERKEGTEESQYFLYERRFGSFRRSFTLSDKVDVDKITATFENGVLKITMPKTEKAKPRGKKISVMSKT
jgi:HSP20 family protein